MAKVKYQTTVAEIWKSKSSDMLIDSGAMHHFHDRYLFRNFETLKPREVQSASGMSEIVGKGQVFVPIGTGFLVDALFTPNFCSHIISVSMLKKDTQHALGRRRRDRWMKDLYNCAKGKWKEVR